MDSCIEGSKYLWKLPNVDDSLVYTLARAYNISFSVMQVLLTRGLKTPAELDSYLFSSFEKDVPHPSLLKDAQKAVDRILLAIERKEKILICGDYDVDGITSSAMMMICLLPLGAQINFFLPHRVNDGYGLSVKAIQRAAQNKYTVVITVDNGITAFEPALEAQRLGIDLIITDHHKPHDQLPQAYAIIDPHQVDCTYPYKTLAGVGVSFKIMSLLYEKLGLELAPKVYELLLLGTVADVVPLTGENRFWVRHGLQLINKVESLSLRVLKQNARVIKPELSSTDIGFFITPQINALGRLEDARQGVKFLVGTQVPEVELVGKVLKELNEARKLIEKSVCDDVHEIIAATVDLATERIIIASSDKWTPGVIGLAASRIVSMHNRPALLFHITKNNIAKGSCRSIIDFNMFEALSEHKDLLLSFGGHALAAGLSLPADKLPELKARLEATFARKLPLFEARPKIALDAEISLADVTKKLVSDMAYLEPFGNENGKPAFYLKNVTLIDKPILLKDAHVKCTVFADGIIKPVIFFSRPELYPLLCEHKDQPLSMAVYISENHWNGKVSVEFQGIDVAL